MTVPKGEWRTVGEIGVDAGLCWVGDPCYVLHKEEGGDKDIGKSWHEFCDILDERGAHKLGYTQFNYDAGHAGLGVCVSTGFGDGSYPVQVRVVDEGSWGKRIAEVRVVFISEDEDEDNWPEELEQQKKRDAEYLKELEAKIKAEEANMKNRIQALIEEHEELRAELKLDVPSLESIKQAIEEPKSVLDGLSKEDKDELFDMSKDLEEVSGGEER